MASEKGLVLAAANHIQTRWFSKTAFTFHASDSIFYSLKISSKLLGLTSLCCSLYKAEQCPRVLWSFIPLHWATRWSTLCVFSLQGQVSCIFIHSWTYYPWLYCPSFSPQGALVQWQSDSQGSWTWLKQSVPGAQWSNLNWRGQTGKASQRGWCLKWALLWSCLL